MSHTHTNLVRLLSSCDRLSAGGFRARAERRRFETYLSVLQRMWHELAAESEPTASSTVRACAPSEEQLSEYRRRIERLAELLDGQKMLSGAGSALAFTQAQCNASLTREQANAELSSRLHATSRMQAALRDQLLGPAAGTGASATGTELADPIGSPGAAGPSGTLPGGGSAKIAAAARDSLLPRRGGGADSAEAESLSETLARERQAQDDALADLTQMAGALRDRSMQARQAVRAHCSTLDTTSTSIDKNRSKLDQNMSRLRQQLRSMRSSTCYILLMLVAVFALFTFTFLLMKVAPKPSR